jgi:HD-like signal output (HDOD) protein
MERSAAAIGGAGDRRVAVNAETPILAAQMRVAVLQGSLTLAPMPDLAHRVMALLQSDEIDVHQLLDVVGKDPAMVAAILRMSNSASFAGMRVVNDLDQAVARIGIRQVGYLVTALVHRGNFVSRDPSRQDLLHALWDHAVASAMACRRLAVVTRAEPGESFLAGLLHDTGKLLVLRGVEEVERVTHGERISAAVLGELIDVLHGELGYHALRTWNFSDTVCEAARDHHRGRLGPEDGLLARVQMATAMARKVGAHPHPDPELSLLDHPAFERLGLTEDQLAAIIVLLEDEISAFRQLV